MQDPVFPLDHPLAGCDAKVRRGHENFKLLDDEVGRYLDRHPEPISGVGQFDQETQRMRWLVGPVEQPDLTLAALIGEYIHDLRSALDHLAFELSFRDTGGTIPTRKIAFPCCWTRAQWDDIRVQRDKLRGINETHRTMIYRTQPCYRRNDATTNVYSLRRRKRHQLSDLQDFWDHDKHRSLQPIVSAPMQVHGHVTEIRDCKPRGGLHMDPSLMGEPLKEGTQAYWLPVRVTGPDPHVEMDIQVAVGIAFRNRLPALETLGHIGNWVAGTIERFAPVFEGPEARRLWGAPRDGWIDEAPVRTIIRTYTTHTLDA
jgi:hypothetical protein